jgi:hypothetical protein
VNKKIKIKLKTDLNKLRNKADGVIVGWFIATYSVPQIREDNSYRSGNSNNSTA